MAEISSKTLRKRYHELIKSHIAVLRHNVAQQDRIKELEDHIDTLRKIILEQAQTYVEIEM